MYVLYAFTFHLPDIVADKFFFLFLVSCVLTRVVVTRLRSSSLKGSDNVLLRRPPVSRAASSQEGLSELTVDAVRGKSLSSTVTSDGKMGY